MHRNLKNWFQDRFILDTKIKIFKDTKKDYTTLCDNCSKVLKVNNRYSSYKILILSSLTTYRFSLCSSCKNNIIRKYG